MFHFILTNYLKWNILLKKYTIKTDIQLSTYGTHLTLPHKMSAYTPWDPNFRRFLYHCKPLFNICTNLSINIKEHLKAICT